MSTAVTGPTEGITLFPRAEDVFVPDQLGLARYLDPLVTIDLRLVDPAWEGHVHLLSPVEPYGGLLGEDADEHWTGLVQENTLAFTIEDGRYRFLAEPEYFQLARLESDPRVAGFPDLEKPDGRDGVREYFQLRRRHEEWTELRDHYEEQRASLEQARAHLAEHGILCPVPVRDAHTHTPLDWLEQLGGTADAQGNWVDDAAIPVEVDDDAVWPVDSEGRRFHLVATVPGYHYRRSGADSILLFVEPETRTALLTFDWS